MVACSYRVAGVRQQPDDDHVADPVLLEPHVQVGIREAALSPVLLDDEVAIARPTNAFVADRLAGNLHWPERRGV